MNNPFYLNVPTPQPLLDAVAKALAAIYGDDHEDWQDQAEVAVTAAVEALQNPESMRAVADYAMTKQDRSRPGGNYDVVYCVKEGEQTNV